MNKNIILIAIISLLLSACSNTNINNTESKKYDISSINFFKAPPPKKWERRAYFMALTYGYLVLNRNCIYLTDKKNSNKNLRIVHWPWNYSLKQSKTGIHIMDGKQQVAAKIGSFVKLGGAGGGFKNRKTKLNPEFQACYGNNVVGIWAAAPNFKIPKNSKTREKLQKFMKR